MEKKNLAYLIGIALIAGPLISPILSATSEDEDWQLVIDGEDQELIPELEEYRWVLERPPYEQWDKIALWRLVKRDSEPIGAIFIFPGTWMSGEQLISTDEMLIRFLKAIDATPEKVTEIKERVEAHSIPHYLALRGSRRSLAGERCSSRRKLRRHYGGELRFCLLGRGHFGHRAIRWGDRGQV
jgi:hypothetical protein